MRKVFWICFSVTGVCTILAAHLVAHYVLTHPESLVGKCMIGAYRWNEKVGQTAITGYHAMTKFQGSTIAAVNSAVNEKVAEYGNDGTEKGGLVEGCCAQSEQTHEGVEEAECPPTRLEGKLTIGKDLEPAPAIRIQPTVEQALEPERFFPEIVPAHDAEVTPKMPYADEVGCQKTENSSSGSFWKKLFAKKGEGEPAVCAHQVPTEPTVPECREENREHHSPGCPHMGGCPHHSGCPFPYARSDRYVPTWTETKPVEETIPVSQPKKLKGLKVEELDSMNQNPDTQKSAAGKFSWLQRLRKRLLEQNAVHPDIDTTEFRPSDARPYDLGAYPY